MVTMYLKTYAESRFQERASRSFTSQDYNFGGICNLFDIPHLNYEYTRFCDCTITRYALALTLRLYSQYVSLESLSARNIIFISMITLL